MEKFEYRVAGTLINGERFAVIVKATNTFHAIRVAEKKVGRTNACSAVKVA